MIDLIDLSVHNGTIDFVQVAAANVQHIAHRLTLGVGSIDKAVNVNVANAAAAGIGVSYYHLGYPSSLHTLDNSITGNATLQANGFVAAMKDLPAPELLAIDLENVNIPDLPAADYLVWLTTWLQAVQALTGIIPVIYGPVYWLDGHLPDGHGLWDTYPYWCPNYNDVTTPSLPKGCASYYLWQYTSVGDMAGVAGHVDCSRLGAGCSFPVLPTPAADKLLA